MCYNFRLNQNYIPFKLIYMLPMVLFLTFSGCEGSTVRNNKLYHVKEEKKQNQVEKINEGINLNIKGNAQFYDIPFNQTSQRIPITQSPDKRYIFFISPCIQDNDITNDIIIGYVSQVFNLNIYDVKNARTHIIKRNIPLISTVKWNKDGDTVGFCGGQNFTVYSLTKQKLLFEDDVKRNQVSYFGWSPKGRKIYTEHPNLVNCTIYYLDSNDKAEIYNTNETKYFKGKINDNFYYVTEVNNEMPLGKKAYTSIVNESGNKIKKVYNGKVRDYYKNSLILLGDNNFGLNYIKDINNTQSNLIIDNNYIYDAKFLYNGNFAYITPNNDISKNNFLLKVVDKEGKNIKQIQVSGSSFALFPDGQKARISGTNEETIDFKNNSITSISNSNYALDEDRHNVYEVLRGAYNTIADYMSTSKLDMKEVKKYFINTHNPEQSAYFDIQNMYNNKKNVSKIAYSDKFDLQLNCIYYRDYFENGLKKAEVRINGFINNAVGSCIELNNQIELICSSNENRWYITGFSTFTSSYEYKKVYSLCQNYVKQANQGKLFKGKFKDKYITIGQIQFWQMNDYILSSEVENSKYCKVYLNVKENNKNDNEITVYKLMLSKDDSKNWKIESLSEDITSQLF